MNSIYIPIILLVCIMVMIFVLIGTQQNHYWEIAKIKRELTELNSKYVILESMLVAHRSDIDGHSGVKGLKLNIDKIRSVIFDEHGNITVQQIDPPNMDDPPDSILFDPATDNIPIKVHDCTDNLVLKTAPDGNTTYESTTDYGFKAPENFKVVNPKIEK